MLVKINETNEKQLFDYWERKCYSIPYYFKTDFCTWQASMFNDKDFDATDLFSELHTYVYLDDKEIKGFIQFGLSSFVFTQGAKDYDRHYGIMRNLYYDDTERKVGEYLIEAALEYLDNTKIDKKHAFFHYFGMSCNARFGKLHSSCFYIENLLNKYGFSKEHENVYYSKIINAEKYPTSLDIVFKCGELTKGKKQSVKFVQDSIEIGGCELYYLPQGEICFLLWIFIKKEFLHKGLGTKCMYNLFDYMQKSGITRFDTDTTDSNTKAQGYYLKTGFSDTGRTRSYVI